MSPEPLAETARRIEEWLLDSEIQIARGAHRGGVAGWLDGGGRAEFVYLEITGYYLTAAAWLAAGAASDAGRARRALHRGRGALDWLRSVTANGALPPTRLYLDGAPGDWRNSCIFTFDLAMAARGAACFGAVSGTDTRLVVRDLVGRVREICGASVPLPSHERVGKQPPPVRWSTRPGVYHLKAAAALLRLPADVVGEKLVGACRGSVAHWTAALETTQAGYGLHPLLYGLEGLMLVPSTETLDVAEAVYNRVFAAVAGEGRSDVLAQALRVGALLRASGRLRGDGSTRGLDELAAALVRHVRPDGGVAFAAGQDRANAWCAMFALQALVLASRGDAAGADFLI